MSDSNIFMPTANLTINPSLLYTPDIASVSARGDWILNTYTACSGTCEKYEEEKNTKPPMKKEVKKLPEKALPKDILAVKRIHQSGPVTVVVWEDDTKTVVRRSENTPNDIYAAFCAALAKKVYGNNTRVNKLLKEKVVIPKEKKGKKNDGDASNQEC